MKNPRSFQLSKLKRARVFSFAEMVASWRGGASMPSASTPPRHAANPLRFATRLQASVTGSAGERISPSPLHEKPAVVPTFQVETSAGFLMRGESCVVARRSQCIKQVHAAAPRRESASLRCASSSFGHRRSPESESHHLRFMKNPRSFQLSKLKRARVFSFVQMVASCLRRACVLLAS